MRPVRLFLLAAITMTAAAAVPSGAADAPPEWEATKDAGTLGDDIARRVVVSPRLDRVNQGLDTVVVSGDTMKPAALATGGLDDLDVGTTAYDARTGAVRWSAMSDGGLGVDATLAGLEINEHNNNVYEVLNVGSDVVYQERGVRDGKIGGTARIPSASASDTASEGAFVGIAGRSGADFLVAVYQTGQPILEVLDRPTQGSAASIDMPLGEAGSLQTQRSVLVTGSRSGFGTGGDMYTAAYNFRDHKKLWERTYASPNNRLDSGAVAEAAHVTRLGKGVGFVVGKSYTPERGFDFVVTAYDLATGASLWSGSEGLRFFDGTASKDDVPMYAHYSDATSTLYVTGTSNRAPNTDQDVVTIAYDAVSGQQKAVAYASGGAANGDDTPTGLTVSPDGRRVLITADVTDVYAAGSQQAALIGYTADLAPIGQRVVGGAGRDRSAGLAIDSTASRVLVAGSAPSQTTGYDHRVSAFGLAGFVIPPTPVATRLSFTADSARSGEHTDLATMSATLTDASGAPLPDRPVTLSLAGATETARTDATGVVRATFTVTALPGAHGATATYDGESGYLSSTVTASFAVLHERTTTTLSSSGSGLRRTLSARLFDHDTEASGLAARTVVFLADGVEIARVTTDAQGAASTGVPPGYRGGTHTYTARFDGDDRFVGSAATVTT